MVDIIPKKTGKEIELKNIYFFIAGALLLAVILGYVILIGSEAAVLSKTEDLEASILKVGTREDRETERKVFESESKIRNIGDLWAKRRSPAEFLNNLDGIVHPRVWFSSLNFSPAEIKMSASGKAADFKSLEQQIIYFRSKSDIIKSFDLSKIALAKDGTVDFDLTVEFAQNIFKSSQK